MHPLPRVFLVKLPAVVVLALPHGVAPAVLEHVGGLGTVGGELSQAGGAVVDLLLQVS